MTQQGKRRFKPLSRPSALRDAKLIIIATENKKIKKRTRLEIELIKIYGGFNKKNLNTAKFLPFVNEAVVRAMKLDTQPEQRWPLQLGTRIYLLVEKII